jgi:hypothetical protein
MMTHPLIAAHLSGAVLGALTPANPHAPDLDDDKDLSFVADIQTVRARQFWRTKERHQDPPHRADTPRATPRSSPVKTEQYNKYKRQGGNELAAFLCNTLEKHGEQPGKVLRRAGLAGAECLPPPMNRTIKPEYLFVFVGSVQGILILLLSVPPGFLRGGHVTHHLSSLPGLASYF